nr:restriction endonuclease subunit S [Priestia megaterium]
MEKREKSHDWIGQIPIGWQRVKLKYAVIPINEKVSSESLLKYVGLENIESKTGKYIENEESINVDGISNRFKVGDILFGKLRPYLSKCIIAEFDGKGTTELLILRQKKLTSLNRFIKYIVLNEKFIDVINSSTYGAKMPRANWDFIGEQVIPLPSLNVQFNIADFLDQKTSEIDALIADKEKLIELLEEKRQAIITEAVTKGLNPDAKMKDSGVEWIGEIPEHWNIAKLGLISNVIDPEPSHRAPSMKKDNGFPYVGIRDLNRDGSINLDTARMIEEESLLKQEKRFTIENTDIVFCRVATLGLPRIIKKETRLALSATLSLIKHKPTKIDYEFLFYYLDSLPIKIQTELFSTGSTRKSLGMETIRKFDIILPDLEEQKIISDHLREKTVELEKLILTQSALIENLKEYRQSLIYEAVTGKIDLRNYKGEEV